MSLSSEPPDWHALAAETNAMVVKRFTHDRGAKFCEFLKPDGSQSEDAAFAWDMGVVLASAAEEMRVDKEAGARWFATVYKSLEPYGKDMHSGFAYTTTPHQKEPDLYYDDNEWIGLALMEAYENSGNRTYLKRAEAIFDWLKTGESSELGGGVFWHANSRKEKNTCSNAPTIVYAVKLYRATQDKAYLDMAVRLYEWVKRLQDADGLFWDHIGLNGKIDRTKWTYNSALMIRANIELLNATKDASYLAEAKRIAGAAREHWVDPSTGAIKDEAGFAHHLADAWLELDSYDPSGNWRATAERAIDYAFRNTSDKEGVFGHRWNSPIEPGDKRTLLPQGSMARALWHAAAGTENRSLRMRGSAHAAR